jgi:hypothetical protein
LEALGNRAGRILESLRYHALGHFIRPAGNSDTDLRCIGLAVLPSKELDRRLLNLYDIGPS